MDLPAGVRALANRLWGANGPPPNDMARVVVAAAEAGRWSDVYGLLELYYGNNSLYDSLQRRLYEQGVWHEGMKALRNPTYRVVEFYASKLWGGFDDELGIEAESDLVEPAIRRLWKWSNWSTKKVLAGRQLAMYGDQFIQIAQNATGKRVFFTFIQPAEVTDFDHDDRDNIVWLRQDTPSQRRTTGMPQPYLRTAIWSKAAQSLVIYESNKTPETPINQLGNPVQMFPFADMGIDFVPIVHTRFKDVGHKRGQAAIIPALDKIDEANRVATRLHQMMFRNSRVTWALAANQVTGDGRPVSAPRVQPDDPAAVVSDGSVQVGDERMFRLPGNVSMSPMVPDLPYADMLAVLQDHVKEIENDLPELAYYNIRQMSDPSGRAVRTLLSDTVDRAMEARGQHYTGVIRANMMGLTVGKAAGLELFQGLGEFDEDELEHTIEGPPVIAISDFEKAETRNMQAAAANGMHELGVSRETLITELGYDYEVESTNREDEDEASAGGLLTAFERGDVRALPAGGRRAV